MKLQKTNEKLLIWLFRMNFSQQQIADKMNITRQALSQKIKTNSLTDLDLQKLRVLGFNY